MHGIGESDIDSVDGGIVHDLVELFVAIDGGCGDVVLGGDFFGFVAVSADECGDLGVGGGVGAGDEVAGDAAESNDGVADFLLVGTGGSGDCAVFFPTAFIPSNSLLMGGGNLSVDRIFSRAAQTSGANLDLTKSVRRLSSGSTRTSPAVS